MDYQAFMQKIAEITENNADDLSLDMPLDDIGGWSSLAMISFIAMCDSEFGIRIKTRDIKAAQTLGDIYDLVADVRCNSPLRRKQP
ncbi:MAG: acyl carrier protein [Chloroflexi bacterium]|nr:acyl carrier protein [Chloroflexota bacterium]